MKKIFLNKNPFLLFLPFLIFYISLVFIFPTSGTYGDESRYLTYARYMIDGTLPQTNPEFDHLGNGPGYSIILIPFIALHTPLICITVLNAVLLYLSIVLLFKTAIKYCSFRKSFLISLFWGLFINSYVYIDKILPEILANFLICLLLFNLTNAFKSEKSKKYIFLSGFVFGYMALVKPIFGYVLLTLMICTVALWLFNRKVDSYRNTIVILVIALTTTMPYLAHTYKVTGKLFYWSTLGGNNLYWATETDPYEYGSWFPDPGLTVDPNEKATHLVNFQEQVKLKHEKDFEEIYKYHGVQQDEVYRKLAINNIKSHPDKYLINCISNLGRILFNLPYSYKLQSPLTLIRFPFNGILVVLMLFTLVSSFRKWRRIEYSLRFALMLSAIYLGGSLLGCAETRMFTVIVPVILLWVSYNFERNFKINFKFK